MMRKTLLLAVVVFAALILIIGCEEAPAVPDDVEEIEVPGDELPVAVQEWIAGSLNDFGAQILEYEELLYLLVTYGEKPTGGYAVEITSITEEDGKLVVTVDFSEPGEDEMVTQALTYPYDLAMLDDPGLPVEFLATGAEDSIPVIE